MLICLVLLFFWNCYARHDIWLTFCCRKFYCLLSVLICNKICVWIFYAKSFLHVPASIWIQFLDYVLICLFDSWLSRFWYFSKFSKHCDFAYFENFIIYTFDPNLKIFSIMPFETLKWFWKFCLKNIFQNFPYSI